MNRRTYGPGPVADHVGALLELREAGLLRHVGLSNVGVAQLDEALALTPVVEVQNRYALDSRRPGEDDVLRACGSGASRSCRSSPSPAPAGSGASGPEHPEVRAVSEAHGATPAQVRLAWTLHQGPHVLAIKAPARPRTWRRTSRPPPCGSPTRRSPGSTASTARRAGCPSAGRG